MLNKILSAVVLFCLAMPAMAWFDCNWPFRTDIFIDETGGVTVADYQVKLELDNTSFHAGYDWSSAGDDIRLIDSDDLTPLGLFIESWDAVNQTAVIWVNVDLAASQQHTVYLYYGNTESLTASDATQAFTELGTLFHTRNSTSDPSNKAQAMAAFDTASDGVAGYGCSIVSNFASISNRSQNTPPSINANIGAISEAFFEVDGTEAGLWSFRYGGDFGRGGGLYVDGVALEESWSDDLWWAFNWASSSEVLEGSINLTEGFHKLEAIGFEGCCDGAAMIQFRKPGGTYQDFSAALLDIRSRKCPVTELSIQWDNLILASPSISIGKSSTVLSDPVRGADHPKRIPGALVRYQLLVKNSGAATTKDSINIKDSLPSHVKALIGATNIGFSDGAPSSQLSFSYGPTSPARDDVGFSDDGGLSYTYIPVSDGVGADGNISDINFSPKNRLGCSNTATPTSFSIYYDVVIK